MSKASVLAKSQSKARWNKNKKKNWRKKIDLSHVEDALDQQRLELRTGGLVRDKADKEIFYVEKKGSHDLILSNKPYKRQKRLMVDKIILPDPNAVIPKTSRNSAKLRRQEKRRQLNMKLKTTSPKDISGIPTVEERKPKNSSNDFWEKMPNDIAEEIFGENDVEKHTSSVIGKKQIRRPKHLLKTPTGMTKSVEVAHVGASYNPSYEDHQTLLWEEHTKELHALQAEKRLERALFYDPSQVATNETYVSEMMEGLYDDSCDSEEESDEVGSLDGPVGTIPQKITKKKRKMMEKLRQEEKQAKVAWANKMRENEVYRAKTFLNEIKQKEKKSEIKKRNKLAKVRMPVLSRVKFKEPDQDLKLSSEICSSLRQLRPEGNLMVDRYKSLQKRCIIEPRERFKPRRRKYKVKYQEKRSFREIEV